MVTGSNQVRHIYVVNSISESALTSASALGAAYVGTTPENEVYVSVVGKGGITRSDLIKNVEEVTLSDTTKCRIPLKKTKVSFVGNPIKGKDYILNIKFTNFIGMGDEDTYVLQGYAHATNTTAGDVIDALIANLKANMSKELNKLVSVEKSSGAIMITELEQPFVLGLADGEGVNFSVYGNIVTDADGEDVVWANVQAQTPTTYVKNGRKYAALEYFLMGERGDNYRMAGYPNYIPTAYMVEADAEYYALDVHFSYIGANHAIQKSEKDVIFLSKTQANLTAIKTAIEAAMGGAPAAASAE